MPAEDGQAVFRELGEAFELHFQVLKMTLRATNNAIREEGALAGLATFLTGVLAYLWARDAQKTWGDKFDP